VLRATPYLNTYAKLHFSPSLSSPSMGSDPSNSTQGNQVGIDTKHQDLDDDSERQTVGTAKLRPHPTNDATYNDRTELAESFLASIDEHGILTPLVITPDRTIISGHRRWEAARQLGMDNVPVEVQQYENELERREAVIEHNRQRDKTFRQKMREADVLEEIERQRAKERQGDRTDLRENSPEGEPQEYGRRRERIADKIAIGSGKTYEHARTVWEAARDGDTVAKHEVDKLDRGTQSVHGAWKKVAKRHSNGEETGDNGGTGSDSTGKRHRSERETDGIHSGEGSEGGHEDETLDSDEVILSAHRARNADVFPKVLDLHVDRGAKIADVTYGQGTFWEQVPADAYDLHATDIDPAKSPDSDDGVDCRDLPYADGTLDCVVLDPPYAGGFYDKDRTGGDLIFPLKERYGNAPDGDLTYHNAVLQIYTEAAKEAHRVLRDDGLLIAKMQDEVNCGENHLTRLY